MGPVEDDDNDAGAAAKASSGPRPKAKPGTDGWKPVHEEFFLRFLPNTAWQQHQRRRHHLRRRCSRAPHQSRKTNSRRVMADTGN